MDTNALISETAQLYNQAAAARNSGDERGARAALGSLRDLLNKELEIKGEPGPLKPAEPSKD